MEIERPDSASACTQSVLTRARHATRLQFMALGVIVGTWGAHIPSLKGHYALSEVSLSLVLLAAGVGTVLSLLVAGRIVGKLGARRAAAYGGLVASLLLAALLEYPSVALLMGAALIFGASASLFDVSINTEGSVLESLGGRAIMSNLHGMFSVGGMTGAALAAWMLDAGVPLRLQLFAVCSATAIAIIFTSRGMLETHAGSDEGGDGAAKAHFVWPTGLLLIIGLLIFAGMTAEGVMYDWSVLYLNQEIGMSQASAALGYATFSAAMALTRFGGDFLRSRHSERMLLRTGAVIAAVAMTVILLSANRWVALTGMALVGAGLALVAPILFNAATCVPGVSRAAAIAAVTAVGYSGFMIGPPLIGSIATATSLTLALG
ncbi:MAG: MFS transporter, partial [Casimicrobiaceae bacterium]